MLIYNIIILIKHLGFWILECYYLLIYDNRMRSNILLGYWNFKTTSEIFNKLYRYTIHGVIMEQIYSLFYCLTRQKTKTTWYRSIFKFIKILYYQSSWSPSTRNNNDCRNVNTANYFSAEMQNHFYVVSLILK